MILTCSQSWKSLIRETRWDIFPETKTTKTSGPKSGQKAPLQSQKLTGAGGLSPHAVYNQVAFKILYGL